MMRFALILALVSAPAFAPAQEQGEAEQVEPKECQSCTARHKSLQSLQKALSTPDAHDKAPEDETAEAADD